MRMSKKMPVVSEPELPKWFRRKFSPSKEFVSDEICAGRKSRPELLSTSPECKKCKGRNTLVEKKRKYTRKKKA